MKPTAWSCFSSRSCGTALPLSLVLLVQCIVVYMLWSSRSAAHAHGKKGATHEDGHILKPSSRDPFKDFIGSAGKAMGLGPENGGPTGHEGHDHEHDPVAGVLPLTGRTSKTLRGMEEAVVEREKVLEERRHDPWLTRQVCHQAQDESEMCVYDGPMCLRPGGYVFGVDDSKGHSLVDDDSRGFCMDYRYFEQVEGCSYNGPFRRENAREPAYSDPIGYAQQAKHPSISIAARRWGPALRTLRASEMIKSILVRATSPDDLARMPLEWQQAAAAVSRDGPAPHAAAKFPLPSKIVWLDGALYSAPLQSGWMGHIWHFSTAAMGLYDAKRQNLSHVSDAHTQSEGFDHHIGGQWRMPPMDYVAFPDGDNRPTRSVTELGGWQQAIMPLLTQPQTKLLFNGNMREEPYSVNDDTWLCARSGVALGLKAALFTGHADAIAFRAQAYALAGVTAPAWSDHPPARISIIHRPGTRGIVNFDAILAVVKETGMPLEVVEDMGRLNFKQQVELMANTGILIATHGGALMNVAFLPQHAALIEAFPYLMSFDMYSDIAHLAGVSYFRLRSNKPDLSDPIVASQGANSLFGEQPFIDECEEPRHINAADASLKYQCNSRSKSTSITIDIAAFKLALAGALDAIGCRDAICKEDITAPGGGWIAKTRYTNMRTGQVVDT